MSWLLLHLLDVLGNIQSQAAQRRHTKQFIAQDDYLSGKRGQYTEKYGAESPWFSQLDLRILTRPCISTPKAGNTLQFSIDLVNFGNLISSEWGVREYATTSGYFQPISVAYNGNNPTYQFDPSLKSTFAASPDLPSRWQMQLGLRYIF